MKKNLKQALVPLAVMVFGAAAAFATNAVKQSEKPALTVPGYHYDSSKPVNERCTFIGEFDCTPESGTPICLDSNTEQVWELDSNGVTCSIQLFQRM